ncbi:MAG: GvpL/GvpF family gas vesicle protein [bacterium]
MNQGIYLFCLTPENDRLVLADAGDDPAQPLAAAAVAGVTAIVAPVSLNDFCGPESRARLADLAWVGPRAQRHEEVILAVMRQAPVLPVRFGSVFSSLAALSASLERQREAMAQFFLDTAGHQEWTLKAFVDRSQARARVMATRLAAEKEQLDALAPGKRYLQEQKINGVVDREVAFGLKKMAAGISLFFQEVAPVSCVGRLLPRDVTGRDDEMFFHSALLVPDGAVAQLQRLAAAWNARHASMGMILEASGPWPLYHFTPVSSAAP